MYNSFVEMKFELGALAIFLKEEGHFFWKCLFSK